MNILGMGLDFTGELLFQSKDENAFATGLVDSLGRNAQAVQVLSKTTSETLTFRGEVDREILDPGDPRKAGWTFLLNSVDPQRQDFIKILQPLAEHRGMEDPNSPLLYNGEPAEDWFDWLHENYFGLELDGKKTPHYILIVGNPDQVPFGFQSILNTVANVGRVAFDTLDDLKVYVDKLIRIEAAADPLVTRDTLVFGTDAGFPDPTYFSRQYMAEPIADHIRDVLGLATRSILGKDATKQGLQEALGAMKPALVYTASHGLIALHQPLEVQKQYNGAICCQKTGKEKKNEDWLFMADDIPLDKPFLEGSVFFQFACFGYGTPAQSDFAHWTDGVPAKYTDKDFVAALPKRLLAHPQGPIAFIGHLDTAFLHGFADPQDPLIMGRWHTRIAPFVGAVDNLLRVEPSGLSMRDMSNRYSVCNAMITSTYDREQRGKLIWNDALKSRFLDTWITRSDAQNYMVFGDPAVGLRIPAG